MYYNRDILLKVVFSKSVINMFTGDEESVNDGGRERFSKENLSGLRKKQSGDDGEEQNKSKWTHFEFMMFLIDVICSRKTEGNVSLLVDVIENRVRSTQHGDGKTVIDRSVSTKGCQRRRQRSIMN